MAIHSGFIEVKRCTHGGVKTSEGLWGAEECGILGRISKHVCLRVIFQLVVGGSVLAPDQERGGGRNPRVKFNSFGRFISGWLE